MNEFNYDDSTYLAHHGIKGMKWGVRKDRSAYRTSDAIKNRIKKASFSKGDENYIRLDHHHALATNKPAYKATLKRRGKRLAIGAGATAAGIGAAALIGAGIAKHKKNKNNGYHSYNDPILQNRSEANAPNLTQEQMDRVIKYRRAKDIQNQMRNGRGLNYI